MPGSAHLQRLLDGLLVRLASRGSLAPHSCPVLVSTRLMESPDRRRDRVPLDAEQLGNLLQSPSALVKVDEGGTQLSNLDSSPLLVGWRSGRSLTSN